MRACGEAITIPGVKVYDAAVVQCSSCGGARSGSQAACRYCGSDFILHERDLHTVCPQCMARISDRARFCHHCATPILPQGSAGEPTDHSCPACGKLQSLASRTLGDERVTVLECGRCGGVWLNGRVFALLEERMQTVAASGDTFDYERNRGRRVQRSDRHGRFYRACPECGTLMHRRNYGQRSGVVVDTCKAHGVWFDLGELHTVLRWIKAGGLARARQLERRRAESDKRLQRLLKDIDNNRDRWTVRDPSGNRRPVDLVGSVLDYLFGE